MVAPPVAVQVGHPLAASAGTRGPTASRRASSASPSVQRRDVDLGAERRLREADRHVAHHVGAFAHEERMLAHAQHTYRSPAGPPLPPLSPSPRSFRREPLSTPAGIRTFSVCVRRRAPPPPHVGARVRCTVPCPLQLPHVLAIVKKPCWKRICPSRGIAGRCRRGCPSWRRFRCTSPHVARRGIESVFSHRRTPPPRR